MKKLLQTAFALSLPFLASAQIEINSSDFPTIGTVYFEAEDTVPINSAIVAGNAGASQTYNFTALHQETIDSLPFLSPSDFAFGAMVPNADIVIKQFGGHAFAEIGTSKVELIGYSGGFGGFGINVNIVYNNPQTILEFPTTYGLTYDDTNAFRSTFPGPASYASYIDSVRISHYGTTESTIDAWGSITTPLGTFDILRNKTVEHSVDSIFAKKDGSLLFPDWTLIPFSMIGVNIANPVVNNTTTYDYLSKDKGYFVVRLVIDNDQNDSIQSVRYLSAPDVGFNDLSMISTVLVYPNPANEVLNIEYTGNNTAVASLYDITGKAVVTQEIFSGLNSINTTTLPAGFYFAQVENSKGQRILNSKISVSK